MKPRNISIKWAQIALSIGIFGMFSQLSAGVAPGTPGALPVTPGTPGALPVIPGTPGGVAVPTPGGVNPVTGVPSLPPGGLPGGVGTLPTTGIPTNSPPMIPGGLPGGIPGGIPGGLPGVTPPSIDPVTGIPTGGPIGGGPTTGPPPDENSNVSTNAPPVPIITPEMMQEALRVFIRESKTIQREARTGNPRQQHNLAVLYTLGVGVPLDFKRAHHWFHKAALQGLPESQFNLAIAYQGGMGVRKDVVTAYKFYSLAAIRGLPVAGKARDHIAQFMTRIQIETAQRMARGFHQGIERWEEMKDLEKAGQSSVNRILGFGPDPNGSGANDGN